MINTILSILHFIKIYLTKNNTWTQPVDPSGQLKHVYMGYMSYLDASSNLIEVILVQAWGFNESYNCL